jgi:hypothetical protein
MRGASVVSSAGPRRRACRSWHQDVPAAAGHIDVPTVQCVVHRAVPAPTHCVPATSRAGTTLRARTSEGHAPDCRHEHHATPTRHGSDRHQQHAARGGVATASARRTSGPRGTSGGSPAERSGSGGDAVAPTAASLSCCGGLTDDCLGCLRPRLRGRMPVDLRVPTCRQDACRFGLLRFDVLAAGLGCGDGTWVPCRSRTVRGPRNAVRRREPQPRPSMPWCHGAAVSRSRDRHRPAALSIEGIGARRAWGAA